MKCGSVFVMIRFVYMEATRSHYSVFVQKTEQKTEQIHQFLSVYTDPPDMIIKGGKDVCYCAFTSLMSSETHC